MNTDAQSTNDSRRRRRVLIISVVVLAAAFAGGAVWAIPRIQDDLAIKVSDQLTAAGIGGVTIEFSGQDGILRCVSKLADPAGVKTRAENIEGVRAVTLNSVCMGTSEPAGGDPSSSQPTSSVNVTAVVTVSVNGAVDITGSVVNQTQQDLLVAAVTEAFGDSQVNTQLTLGTGGSVQDDTVVRGLASVVSVLAGRLQSGEVGVANGRLYLTGLAVDDAAVLALTASALDAGAEHGDIKLTVADVTLESDLRIAAVFDGGNIVLTGKVATDTQMLALLGAVTQVLDPANVNSKITVESGIDVNEVTLGNVASLIVAMPPNLLRGRVDFGGTAISATGTFLTDATRAAFEQLAARFDVTVVLEPRPVATALDAAELQVQLNDFVAANPILFQSDEAVLTPSSNAILDRIASLAKHFAGTYIEVQGHTDNTGDPVRNLALSQRRADAVVLALAGRFVPFEQLSGVGFGITKPKLPNTTNENRAINRRVEFAVTTK